MKFIEEGKTAQEAIEKALQKHKVSRDDAKIEIIDKGKRGFLGIGAKPAKIEIEIFKQPVEKRAKKHLEEIIKNMGLSASVEAVKTGQKIELKVTSGESSLLIGRRGQTLMALEHLVGLYISKDEERALRAEIDIDSYRKKRINSVKQIATKACEKAKKTGKPVYLPQMDFEEQKFIYNYFKNDKSVSVVTRRSGKIKKVMIKPSESIKAENRKAV